MGPIFQNEEDDFHLLTLPSQSSTRLLWREESPELTRGSRARRWPEVSESLFQEELCSGAHRKPNAHLVSCFTMLTSSSEPRLSLADLCKSLSLLCNFYWCVSKSHLCRWFSDGSRVFLLDESLCTSFRVRLNPYCTIFQCCLIYHCVSPNPGPFVHLKLAPWARLLPYCHCTRHARQIQFSLFS